MRTHDSFDQELARFNPMSIDQLYAELAPKDVAFDFNGRIAAGKEVLQRVLREGRGPVCRAYRANKSTVNDSGELIKIVTESLKAVVAVAGLKIPVIPLAVILFKLGLDRLCPELPGE